MDEEGLIDRILELVLTIIESGETLDEDLIRSISTILAEAIQNAQNPPIEDLPSPPTEQPLSPSMPSSNINAFGYDEENGQLLVKFNGKNARDAGPIYSYEGVPKVIFDLFRKGSVPARTDGQNKWGKWWKGKLPSIGASMYTLIKTQNYPYQRVA